LQTDIPGQEQGAQIVVKLATVPYDGPSGGFFNDDGAVPW
jgi:hypothetical protein